MPRIFTLGTLVTRCQQRVSMENEGHITEWKSIISTVYAELYSILVESGMRYFESTQDITTDGSATYALPSDHLGTIGVDYVVNATTDERRALAEMMVQERNRLRGITGTAEAVAYAFEGSNLALYPTPPSGQTYKHLYVPQPTELSASADGTNIDVVTPDGENFLIWGAAVIALEKTQEPVQGAVAERERARQRVEWWATQRALNQPRRRIVEGDLGETRWDPADWRY